MSAPKEYYEKLVEINLYLKLLGRASGQPQSAIPYYHGIGQSLSELTTFKRALEELALFGIKSTLEHDSNGSYSKEMLDAINSQQSFDWNLLNYETPLTDERNRVLVDVYDVDENLTASDRLVREYVAKVVVRTNRRSNES